MEIKEAYAKHQELFPDSKYAKSTIRADYLNLCRDKNLTGSSFWLSGDSTEILDYLALTGADPSTVWNCEVDPQLHAKLTQFYGDLGCNMGRPRQRLHEVISDITEPIVYGHADFIGNACSSSPTNKTSTFTAELIYALFPYLADHAVLAFTHTKRLRNSRRISNAYYDLITNYNAAFSTDFDVEQQHPAFIVGLLLSSTFSYLSEYDIRLIDNVDYASTHSDSRQQHPDRMNKCTFELTKGGFNKDAFIKQMKAIEYIHNTKETIR